MNNLWDSLLKDISKNSSNINKNNTSTIFIINDEITNISNTIESQLIQYNNNTIYSHHNNPIVQNNQNDNHIINYNYMITDDNNIINIYSYNSLIWENKPNDINFYHDIDISDQILFIISIDLSSNEINTSIYISHIINLINKLFKLIDILSNKIHNKFGNKYSTEKKSLILAYLQEMNGQNVAIQLTSVIQSISINIGFPIVIVGRRIDNNLLYDKIDEYQLLQRNKLLQGQLRSIALDIGAAIIFININNNNINTNNKNNKNDNSNIIKLKKYILHRLFPNIYTIPDIQIENSWENFFVPAGLDNHQLISNNTGYVITTETPKINTSVDIISQNGKSFETINSTPTLVEIESEKDWLLSLQGFVNLTAAVDTTTNNTNIHKVTSSNGVSNDSNGEASNGLSIDVTEANNPNSKIPLSKTPVSAVASTRRQSTDKLKSNVTQDKKEVGDFFRNLLVQGPGNTSQTTSTKKK